MESDLVLRNISIEGPAVTPEELEYKVEEVRCLLLAERGLRALSEDRVSELVDLVSKDSVEES